VAVVLGLAVAASYGAADFLGGFASARAPATTVVVTTQTFGLVLAAVLLVVFGWDALGGRDVGLGVGAGLAQLVGVTALYRGLAAARMAVVAPVSAVVSALIPVTWGLARGEEPSALALVGVVLALAAGAIVARTPDGGGPAWEGVPLALLAGVGFGVSFVCFGETSDDSGFWPVVLSRATAASVLVAALVARRRALRLSSSARRPALAAGALDMTATAVLLVAVRRELMSLVAPVASLYPAGTVVLARVVLDEPIGRERLAGLGLALVARVHRRLTASRAPRPRNLRRNPTHTRVQRRKNDNGGVLLADVVATSDAVAATRSRLAKVDAIATLLRRLAPDEVEPVVGFLVGEPRHGRVGVGWATLQGLDVAPAGSATLTAADLDRALGELAAAQGPGSQAARRAALTSLLARATAPEADFVRRLLLGEMRQGALDGIMADAVAKAAGVPVADVRRAAMLRGDLRDTARRALHGGTGALVGVGLRLLRPVQPMLAAGADSLDEALAATGPASVEWKLDGARIQVHRAGDDVGVFTRNLNDVTDRLPEVVAAVRTFAPSALVLDGEAIGLGDDARPHRFQDTMSRFGRTRVDEHGIPLTAFFFDCLHADGTDLLDRPLAERLDVLDAVAGERRIPGVRTGDPGEARRVFDEALAAGHEGVVVKALASPYDAGRRGAAWRKVKPVLTLDLVVLAVEWGSGRRRGWLSNLHLGARDPGGGFVMVGKTFKGLTDELLEWQTEQLSARSTSTEGHVVHVAPELVVEIALDGVQASRRYPGGVALRFARVRRYRTDKRAGEADTIDAVRALLPR
jgi:DNA ligase-1